MTDTTRAGIGGRESPAAGGGSIDPAHEPSLDAEPGPPPTPSDIARQRVRFLFRCAGDGLATTRLRQAVLDWRLENLA